MTLSRKFFSAPTLTRALLDAARHHGVEPDAIVYQVVDKKTGFVKAPRGVLIEVDPEAPTGSGSDGVDVAETAAAAEPANPRPSEPAAEPSPAPSELLSDVEASGSDTADAEVERVVELAEEPPAPASPTLEAATESPVTEEGPISGSEPVAEPAVEAVAEPAVEAPIEPAPETTREAVAASAVESTVDPAGESDGGEAPEQPSAQEVEEAVARAVDDLACLASLRVQVASVARTDDGLEIELEGPDGDRLAARGGRALLSMQHLLPRLLFHDLDGAFHCRLDCDGFQQSREEHFERLAKRAADKVRNGGRPWMLDPMAPDERRLVHLALAADDSVETNSIGEGFLKRVRVSPA